MTEPGRDKAFEEFMNPGPLPEGANLPEAEARLLAALEQELGVPLVPVKVVRPSRFRPLLAFAAVVLAAAGLTWSLGTLRSERPVLRGPASTEGWAAEATSTKLDARRTRLTWHAAPRATSYGVTFLSEDLREVAHVDDLKGTTLLLDRVALPVGLVSGRPALWRVTAYAGADELARSDTAPLEIP